MTTGQSDLVDITAELKHETDKAYLIDDGSGKEVWVPKSHVERSNQPVRIAEKGQSNHTFEFTMPEWLATEKGLI